MISLPSSGTYWHNLVLGQGWVMHHFLSVVGAMSMCTYFLDAFISETSEVIWTLFGRNVARSTCEMYASLPFRLVAIARRLFISETSEEIWTLFGRHTAWYGGRGGRWEGGGGKQACEMYANLPFRLVAIARRVFISETSEEIRTLFGRNVAWVGGQTSLRNVCQSAISIGCHNNWKIQYTNKGKMAKFFQMTSSQKRFC